MGLQGPVQGKMLLKVSECEVFLLAFLSRHSFFICLLDFRDCSKVERVEKCLKCQCGFYHSPLNCSVELKCK